MFGTFLDSHPLKGMIRSMPGCPYPVMSDRAAWESLPDEHRADLLALYENHREPYPLLSATQFLGFVRSGSRAVYETPYFYRRRKLIAATLHCCVTGGLDALDEVIDGLWCICEESSWVISAHNVNPVPHGLKAADKPLPDVDDPYIDLFAAQTAMILAHVCALMGEQLDEVTPLIRRRVTGEIEKRILGPFMRREDFWWMGRIRSDLNNWTPWILSNVLYAASLEMHDPARFAELCDRAVRMLDRWVEILPDDGGCDEGTSYYNMAGGAMLDCLDVLERTTGGAAAFWQEEKIRNILAFPLATRLENGWFVNFADCDARPFLCGERLQLAGEKLGLPGLIALGAEHLGTPSFQISDVPHFTRLLDRLFRAAPAPAAQAYPARDAWLPDLQLRVYEQQGMILCMKGGHNGEEHNHNDVGSFILHVDGTPEVVDAGNMIYTAKTFSDERYTLFNTRAANHNLPLIGGCEQKPGRQYAARDVQRLDGGLSLDLAGAYGKEAGAVSCLRRMELTGGAFLLTDSIALREEKPVTWVFMLRHQPVIGKDSVSFGPLVMPLDGDLTAEAEEYPVTDARMAKNYPGSLWRLTLTAPAAGQHKRTFRMERKTAHE